MSKADKKAGSPSNSQQDKQPESQQAHDRKRSGHSDDQASRSSPGRGNSAGQSNPGRSSEDHRDQSKGEPPSWVISH